MKNQFDIRYFCLASCVSQIYYFHLCLFEHVCVMFGNMSSKVRQLIVEGDYIRFINDIGGTVARDEHCTGVAIKCRAHNSFLGFLYGI